MGLKRWLFTCTALISLALPSAQAQSEASSAEPLKIGVISDMSGIYSTIGGAGMVTAVKMAVNDFGDKVLDRPIEVLTADSQNKVDITSARAREWYDRDKVSVIIEGTDSASGLALQRLGIEKKGITLFIQSASSVLTEAECSPYGVHYVYNTSAFANSVGRAVVESGGDTWFFITADYAFGSALEKDTTTMIEQLGGKVLGSIRHPLGASDFSSFVFSAQSSKAKVVGLANAGRDTQNAIRQAVEFGIIDENTVVAPLLMMETDVKGMGLELAQGLQFAVAYYWDRTPETREFSERFHAIHGAMPTSVQAGAYSATMHYLKSLEAAGIDDPDEVMEKMKATPINDFFAENGRIQKNGMMIHDFYLAKVKSPAESKGEWDLLDIVRTVPGDKVLTPDSESTCPYLKES